MNAIDENTYTDAQKVSMLKGVISWVHEKDQKFCKSLIGQFEKKGSLSEKQIYWVWKLGSKALDASENSEAPITPINTPTSFFKVGNIFQLFENAKASGIKYPKLSLHTDADQPVSLSLAGTASKFPGTITVTDGKGYGANVWFGRIHLNGEWVPYSQSLSEDVDKFLKKLHNDPIGVACSHGHITGRCCFCRKKLTDPKSLAVGYGATCAKNWGLPWGDEALTLKTMAIINHEFSQPDPGSSEEAKEIPAEDKSVEANPRPRKHFAE